MLTIGPYNLSSPTALAPMAGVSDLPFRELCRAQGAGLVTGEMLTADTRLWRSRKSRQRLSFSGEPEPRSVQIAGADPAMLADAARQVVDQGAQIVDINMGCPAKKVCRKAAGSALLQDEALVKDILETVCQAVSVPVTLKIRTGWSPQQRNGVTVARIAEDAGIQALAVHGRTRACKFEGRAEYQTIRDIVAAVGIPVFANGDIKTPQDAKQVLEFTGAAGVMIGRAAQGRPWLFKEINHYLATGELLPAPEVEYIRHTLTSHLVALHHFYGEQMGVRIARKHVGWYLATTAGVGDFAKTFNRLETAEAQLDSIEALFARLTIEKNEEIAA